MMKQKYPYLKDSTFLKEFDENRLKEQYVKIIVLTQDEKPIQSIEGRVTSGNINIDSSSSIRRTCTLSMVADDAENDLTNVDNLISINKKVEIEIGFINNTSYYTNYPMIWFPQGVYVIITPSIVHDLSSGVNISLQLKDKMCLLNGECGGTIPASTTFSEYDTVDETGSYVTVYPTIYQIIQEAVNHFGGEQLSKIIISDVDTRIKKVMKWTGSSPLYIIETIVDGETQYEATTNASDLNNKTYTTYEYGSDIGYIYTDFVYTSELVIDAGGSVCDVLDKIVSYLGNYEYFYDLDGNFIFQEIKNYLNTSQSTTILNNLTKEDYLVDLSKGKATYVFDDSNLITSYSNNPQYNMIKNDFIVWGTREDSEGNTSVIRYHLAIDTKPEIGNTYDVFFYTDETDNLTKAKCPMHFTSINAFPEQGVEETFYMDDSDKRIYKWDASNQDYVALEDENGNSLIGLKSITTTDWRTELYLSGAAAEPLGIDSNYYYTELKNEWPKLYDVEQGEFFEDVVNNPWDIDFYLDFIDSGAEIAEMSISNIGRRTKVVVDDDVNCVFEPDVPDLVFIESGNDDTTNSLAQECINKGQNYIQVTPSIYAMITGGGASNSAYEYVRDLLYQYTSYNETITVSAIPIYYLEPNTRITVRDPKSGIYGDYMISTISIPLDITSTMSISCSRALERI